MSGTRPFFTRQRSLIVVDRYTGKKWATSFLWRYRLAGLEVLACEAQAE